MTKGSLVCFKTSRIHFAIFQWMYCTRQHPFRKALFKRVYHSRYTSDDTIITSFQDGFRFQAFLHHNGHSIDDDFSVDDEFHIKIDPINDNSPNLLTKTHLLSVSYKYYEKKEQNSMSLNHNLPTKLELSTFQSNLIG